MTTVLVADKDRGARRRTAAGLRMGGYAVEAARTLSDAASLLRNRHIHVLVVDPSFDQPAGVIGVIGELRARTEAAIIVVSSRSDEVDKVALLDAGADDYLTKPFGIEELLARLRAVLRRVTAIADEGPIITEDFTIHISDRRIVRPGGEEVRLTPTEWRLVEILVGRSGHLVEHGELLRAVWGPKAVEKTDYLRVYMTTIRRKLEPVPGQPRYFLTAPGLGLRFDATGGTG